MFVFLFMVTSLVTAVHVLSRKERRVQTAGLYRNTDNLQGKWLFTRHLALLYLRANYQTTRVILRYSVFLFGFDRQDGMFGSRRRDGKIHSWKLFRLDKSDIAELDIDFLALALIFAVPFSPHWNVWNLVFVCAWLAILKPIINQLDSNKGSKLETLIYLFPLLFVIGSLALAPNSQMVGNGAQFSNLNGTVVTYTTEYTGNAIFMVDLFGSVHDWLLTMPFLISVLFHFIVKPIHNILKQRANAGRPAIGFQFFSNNCQKLLNSIWRTLVFVNNLPERLMTKASAGKTIARFEEQ